MNMDGQINFGKGILEIVAEKVSERQSAVNLIYGSI